MAKDLPYYKHDVSEWMNGAITLESYEAQGVFINVCSYYWFKSGRLTLTEIKRRLKCKQAVFDSLVSCGVLKVTEDVISISFLDEQLEERGNKSKINSINGSKGGAPKGNSNAKKEHLGDNGTTEKQPKTTNIEEKRTEERIVRISNSEFFDSNQNAFEEISTNHLEMEPARNVVRNNGWSAVTDGDINALLFHFLESQVDVKKQDKSDVKSHFRRWLNKQQTTDLTKLSISIHARRKRQQA